MEPIDCLLSTKITVFLSHHREVGERFYSKLTSVIKAYRTITLDFTCYKNNQALPDGLSTLDHPFILVEKLAGLTDYDLVVMHYPESMLGIKGLYQLMQQLPMLTHGDNAKSVVLFTQSDTALRELNAIIMAGVLVKDGVHLATVGLSADTPLFEVSDVSAYELLPFGKYHDLQVDSYGIHADSLNEQIVKRNNEISDLAFVVSQVVGD